MNLKKIRKGILFKKYYEGFFQSVHTGKTHVFHIEASWFDKLSEYQKKFVYQKEINRAIINANKD